MPLISEELKTARTARTSALTALKKACNNVLHGVRYKMTSLPEYVSHLDTSMVNFLDACLAFCNQAKTDKIPDGDTQLTVGGKNIDEYELHGHESYEIAMKAYKDYVSNMGFSSSKSHTLPSQPQGPSIKTLNFKKRELPTFSGKRKDWAEFKSLFEGLVMPYIENKTALASELKTACQTGDAFSEISHISAGSTNAFDKMWKCLNDHYGNVTLSVFSALDELKSLHPVKKDDNYQSIVDLIRNIASIYSQLEILDKLDLVTSREVTQMSMLFPPRVRQEWATKYTSLDAEKEQLHPFAKFHEFLQGQLKTSKLMADQYLAVQASSNGSAKVTTQSHVVSYSQDSESTCVLHPDTKMSHTTEECKGFKRLSIEKKRELLYKYSKCLRCFNDYHGKADAHSPCSTPCEHCSMINHHSLLCFKHHNQSFDNHDQNECKEESKCKSSQSCNFNANIKSVSLAVKSHNKGLYGILGVKTAGQSCIVFCDDGSDASFIASSAVNKLKARKISEASLTMETLNGSNKVKSALYEVTLLTKDGKRVKILAYRLPELSGEVSQLDEDILADIFPRFNPGMLQRPKGKVDIILGSDWFGLHPKQEVQSNGNISIMSGELGVCVQGSHPMLGAELTQCTGLFKVSVREKTNIARPKRHPARRPAGGRLGGNDHQRSYLKSLAATPQVSCKVDKCDTAMKYCDIPAATKPGKYSVSVSCHEILNNAVDIRFISGSELKPAKQVQCEEVSPAVKPGGGPSISVVIDKCCLSTPTCIHGDSESKIDLTPCDIRGDDCAKKYNQVSLFNLIVRTFFILAVFSCLVNCISECKNTGIASTYPVDMPVCFNDYVELNFLRMNPLSSKSEIIAVSFHLDLGRGYIEHPCARHRLHGGDLDLSYCSLLEVHKCNSSDTMQRCISPRMTSELPELMRSLSAGEKMAPMRPVQWIFKGLNQPPPMALILLLTPFMPYLIALLQCSQM